MNFISYTEHVNAKSTAGAQSVERAIGLLKTFTDGRPEWGLNELAEANGLNRTTAYRLLTTLESEGLLTRNEDSRRYRLGPELIALGGCAMRSHDLRTAARPFIQALAEDTGEAATLEILSGNQVIVLDETSGSHLIAMSQDVGTRLPAHATSTGKVLLAFAQDAIVESTLAGPLARRTEHTVVDSDVLQRQLSTIRQHGYSVAVDELELGFVAIAAPVRDQGGEVIAAVSIGGPSMRLNSSRIDEVSPMVVSVAEHISSQLGYRKR